MENTQTITEKSNVITLENIKVSALEQIKGKEIEIAEIIKANPLVKITDNASYEQAKKNRTALKTTRTSLDKEEKALLGAIKANVTEKVKEVYSGFRATVSPAEDAQQAEITPYEDQKEKERQERLRIEEERKQNHIDAIEEFFNTEKSKIDNLTYEESKTADIAYALKENEFEEFIGQFESKVEVLKMLLKERQASLQQKEDIRAEQQRLADLKAENERVAAENEKKRLELQKENERIQNEQAENQRIANEKIAEQQAELKKGQDALLIATRTAELKAIGFDDDLCYTEGEFKVLFIEDDLLEEKSEWDMAIVEIKNQIAEHKESKDKINEIVVEQTFEETIQEVETPTSFVEQQEADENFVVASTENVLLIDSLAVIASLISIAKKSKANDTIIGKATEIMARIEEILNN